MKHPKFTLLNTKTIDEQIQEIEQRLIIRGQTSRLHAQAIKRSFLSNLSSPKTLAGAAGFGFAFGYLGPFSKPKSGKSNSSNKKSSNKKDSQDQSNSDSLYSGFNFNDHEDYDHNDHDDKKSKSFLAHQSLLTTVLEALPIIELIFSLMPSKKSEVENIDPASEDKGRTEEELFKEATLMQAMSGQSAYHEFSDGVRKSIKMRNKPIPVDKAQENLSADSTLTQDALNEGNPEELLISQQRLDAGARREGVAREGVNQGGPHPEGVDSKGNPTQSLH